MKKNKKITDKFPFILGLSLCNNIFYIFHYNNLYINISNFVSLIIFLYIIFFDAKKLNETFSKINKTFYLYLIASIFSIIPALIYFINNMELLYSYFKGLPSLFLLFIEYFTIIYYSDKKHDILNGIKYGSILNIILSIISFISFKSGTYFTLFKLFPNPSFQICGDYFVLNSTSDFVNAFKIYLYRAQGMFLETSHYLTYVAGSILIMLFFMKNKFNKIALGIIILYLGLLSISGNFVIIIMTCLLYLVVLAIKNKSLRIKKKNILLILFLFIISIFAMIYISTNENLLGKLNYTLSSLNFNDSDNTNRARSIKEGLELIEKYPLGIGYNNTSNVIKTHYPNEIQSYIFSTLLLNELELGLLGNIIYLIFVFKFPIALIKKGRNKEDYVIACSMLGVSLCQLTNGISYWNIQYLLAIYAIGNIYYNEIKNTKEIEKKKSYQL